ncbi:MAG: filamentous hemagglutinin N-terminal domain-containing protein [Deltaproteobacteria bacterium]|nr:filamentous hemagglutinin N-terminal domain-containing protein [Deltaproteobacteria bacterium]
MFKSRVFFTAAALFAAVLLMAPFIAHALPQDGSVTAGGATVSSSGSTMDITQSTQKAIINWGSFSIASGESVNFTQPTASSIALNRVIGADTSFLNGALNANGGVYLLNPNGIIIGNGASVNVSSFLASTMNISDDDFLSGNYNFSQANGSTVTSVVNNGLINASGGDVVLSAPSVTNTGVVSATLGKVFIGAGEQMVLTFSGDSIFGFVVDSATLGGASVDNSGTISANGGEVYITAKSAYNAVKSVVNNSGVIEANAIVNDGGVIRLTGDIITNSGTISANVADNGTAGSISVVANDTLTLASGSIVSAAGADVNSNGGSIYLYSYGNATAEGGQLIDISGGTVSGNGGSAEFSAAGNVAFAGTANGSAPGGSIGTFIIDPLTATVSGTFTLDTTIWAEDGIDITGNVILDTVTAGTPLTLTLLADHISGIAGQWDDGTGTPGTPTLGAITNAGFTITDSDGLGGNVSTVIMYSGDDGAGNAIGTAAAPVILDSIDVVQVFVNPLSTGGVYISSNTGFGVDTISNAAGFVRLIAPLGAITDTNGIGTMNVTAADLFFSTDTGINLDTNVTRINGENITSGDIIIRNTDTGGGLTVDAFYLALGLGWSIENTGGALTLTNNGTIDISLLSANGIHTDSGTITVTATGGTSDIITSSAASGSAFETETGSIDISVGQNITIGQAASFGDVLINIGAPGSFVSLVAGVTSAGGSVVIQGSSSVSAVGDVTVTAGTSGTVTISNGSTVVASGASGNMTVTADGGITLDGSINASGTMTIDSTGTVAEGATGAITASGLELRGVGGIYNLNAGTNNVTLLAADTGSLDFIDNIALTVDTVGALIGITVSGNLTLTADDMIFTSGAGTIQTTGVGALVLQPSTATTTIGLAGGVGGLNLDVVDLGQIQSGFTSITIGSATGSGIIVFGDGPGPEAGFTFNADTTIRNPVGGGISITDPISTGTFNLTLTSGGAVTETIDGGVTTNLLTVNAGAGITLALGTNDATSIKFTETSNSGISYSDTNGVTVSGITAGTGAVSITALGAVGQGLAAGEEILCGQLTINTSGALATAGITATNALNNATDIDLRSGVNGDIYYVDADSFNINTQVNAGTGFASLISGGDLILSATPAGVTAGSFEIGAMGNVTIGAAMTGLTSPTTITAGYGAGTGALTVNFDVSTVASTLTLNGDTVAVNAVVTAGTGTPSTLAINAATGISGSGSVVAATLTAQVTAAGNLTLNNVANNVSGTVNLQTFNGNISYADADAFTVGTITANGPGRNVTLNVNSAATVTQSGIITATGLELLGTTATYALHTQDNAITNLASNVDTLKFQDNTGFNIGAVNTVGVTAATLITLKSTGAVGQTSAINTPGLELLGTGGAYTFAGGNTVGTIAANTGSVKLSDTGGITIGTLNGTGAPTAGITTTGNTILINNGALTNTDKIVAAGLKVSNGAAAITLTNLLNNVSTLNLITTGADIAYTDANGFAIAAIDGSTFGIDTGNTTINNVTLLATGAVTQTNTTANDKIRANTLNIDTQNNGTISLVNTSNDVAALNLVTQNGATAYDIYYVDANSFNITTVDAGTGFASLISGGTLSITAPPAGVTAGSLEIGAMGAVSIDAAISTTMPTTYTAGYGAGTGALTVNFVIDTAASPLTLNGDGITINAAVTAGGGSTLTLNQTGTASITTGVGGSLTTTGILNVNVTGTTGGAVTLTGANDVGTLNITYRGGAVSFTDANGFVLGSTGIVNVTTPTVAAVQNVTLNVTNGSVTEPGTGVILAAGLDLLGGINATYTLGGANNITGNLTGSTGTVYFNDVTGGFGVGNLTASTLLTLKSTGMVTQVAGTIINTPRLELLGVGGAYNLDPVSTWNTVDTIAANTTSVKLKDSGGLTIDSLNGTGTPTNGITTVGDTILINDGTIDNTAQPIIAAGLKVDVTATPTQIILLGNTANNVTNINLLTSGGDITYVDADGVNIAALDSSTEGINTADAVSLVSITAKGDVTQSSATGTGEIIGGTLTVVTTGAAVGGKIDLSTEINNTATIDLTSVSGQPISYKDADDFTITGLSAGTGLVTLYYGQTTPTGAVLDGAAFTLGGSLMVFATGDVTQSSAITLPSGTGVLTVDTTGAGAGTGAITLDSFANEAYAINLVSANDTAIAYKDSTALVINGLNSGLGTSTISMQGIGGALTQAAVITADTLVIDMSAIPAGNGQIQLGGQANAVNAIDFNSNDSTVAFQAAGALTIAALDAGTKAATITAGAGVTHGSAINTTGLLTVNATGVIQLDSFANTVGSVSLSSGGSNIFFWDADGVIVGGTGINSGGASTTLTVAGPVSQGGTSPIIANALTVDTTTGAATTSTIGLATANNNAASVALKSNASAISYKDADAVQIALLDSGTASSSVTAAGTVTQSAAPVVAGLLSVSTTAGGAINLTTAANTAGSINFSTVNSAIAYDAATSVVIAGISSGTGAAIITTNGDVTQSGTIVGGALTVDTTGALAGGAITLGSANDAASISLTSANNSNVTFVDANNIVVTGIAAGTGVVSVTAAGEINGTGTLTGSSVALTAASIGLNSASTVDPVAYNMATTPTIDAPLLTLTITGGGVTGAGEQWGGFMNHTAALVSNLDVTVNSSVFVMVGAWKLPLFLALTAGGTLSGYSAASGGVMLASSTNAAASDAVSNAAYFAPETYMYGDYEPDVTGAGASSPECMSLKKGKTRKIAYCVSASK